MNGQTATKENGQTAYQDENTIAKADWSARAIGAAGLNFSYGEPPFQRGPNYWIWVRNVTLSVFLQARFRGA